MACGVRVRVEDGEGARTAPHDVRLLVGRAAAEDAAEHALDRVVAGGGDVLAAPAGPQVLERHVFDRVNTSARRRSTKSSTLTPRSGSSLPRALTPTVPCSTSSSPTTST